MTYPVIQRYVPGAPAGGGTMAPALVKRGKFFGLANGDYWHGIQTSDFSSVKRFLAGEDVRPLLDERRALGFNELRQWLLNQSVVGAVYPEGIHPDQYPDFYERVRAYWELCGSYGFAIEATAFTSCNPLMTNPDAQIFHWQATQVAAKGLGHVRLELVNEWNWSKDGGQTTPNDPDPMLRLMRPAGILASSGSSTADAPPRSPIWDYVLYHSNGLSEWQRKVGHNAMEWADVHRVPAASNENTRYPDDSSSETHAFDAAAGAALLCASASFHSQGGKYSRPFDATERRCAQAWIAGARSVPLRFQDGFYTHHQDREDHVNKTILRSYSRTLSNGERHYVDIRY